MQASLNSIDVGFIITNNQGEVEMINFAAKQMFCAPVPSTAKFLPDPKLINLVCTIDDISIALQDSLDIKKEIQRCLKGSKPFQFKDIQYKNLFLRVRITPIILIKEDQSLEFIGAVVLVEDTTEEKILERARADFFSIAAHELKTPLAVIKGNTQILKRLLGKDSNDQPVKIMDDIFDSSTRLIEIVDDFLDLSRFEQGRLQFKKELLDLSLIIPSLLDGLKEMAKEKNLSIIFKQDTSQKVLADEARVKQVLVNLVGNAIKFTEKGGIKVDIKEQDGFVKTIISDTGVGISPQNQKLIFRKFQLATDNPLTRSTSRSTGVGLYISKLLVEGMGGQIQLEYSKVGEGSTFSFTLPQISV